MVTTLPLEKKVYFPHIAMVVTGRATTVNILYNPTTCSYIFTKYRSPRKTLLLLTNVCSCLTTLHCYAG